MKAAEHYTKLMVMLRELMNEHRNNPSKTLSQNTQDEIVAALDQCLSIATEESHADIEFAVMLLQGLLRSEADNAINFDHEEDIRYVLNEHSHYLLPSEFSELACQMQDVAVNYSGVHPFALQSLLAQKSILVVMDAAPRTGNQAANVNLIDHFRILGFKGIINLIYPNEKLKTITQFLGVDYNKINEPIYYDETKKIIFIDLLMYLKMYGRGSFPAFQWGFTAALDRKNPFDYVNDFIKLSLLKTEMDESNFANFFNVDVFIKMSPFSRNTQANTVIYFKNLKESSIVLESNNKYLFAKHDTLSNIAHDIQNSSKNIELAELLQLIQAIEQEQVNFMPLYGKTLSIRKPDQNATNENFQEVYRIGMANLLNMILGARYAQLKGPEKLRKPLVMGFFDYVDLQILGNLLDIINHHKFDKFLNYPGFTEVIKTVNALQTGTPLQIIVMSDYNYTQWLQDARDDQWFLFIMPGLEKKFFDTLLASGLFASVSEGASSNTVLLNAGKAQLHCGDGVTPWEIDYTLASPAVRQLLKKMKVVCQDTNHIYESLSAPADSKKYFKFWQTENIAQLIGEYIIQAADAQSELSQFFLRISNEAMSPDNQRSLQALNYAYLFMQMPLDQQRNLLNRFKHAVGLDLYHRPVSVFKENFHANKNCVCPAESNKLSEQLQTSSVFKTRSSFFANAANFIVDTMKSGLTYVMESVDADLGSMVNSYLLAWAVKETQHYLFSVYAGDQNSSLAPALRMIP